MKLPALCVHHSGADPVYRSDRLETIIPTIKLLTRTDDDGRRYYRRAAHEGWRRLRTPVDFAALNRSLDERREPLRFQTSAGVPSG